jgi:hypothetical protein
MRIFKLFWDFWIELILNFWIIQNVKEIYRNFRVFFFKILGFFAAVPLRINPFFRKNPFHSVKSLFALTILSVIDLRIIIMLYRRVKTY